MTPKMDKLIYLHVQLKQRRQRQQHRLSHGRYTLLLILIVLVEYLASARGCVSSSSSSSGPYSAAGATAASPAYHHNNVRRYQGHLLLPSALQGHSNLPSSKILRKTTRITSTFWKQNGSWPPRQLRTERRTLFLLAAYDYHRRPHHEQSSPHIAQIKMTNSHYQQQQQVQEQGKQQRRP